MKVLITAPSLDENLNVSGLSTVVRQIIKYRQSEFVHFVAGRQDGDENRLLWMLSQVVLPIRFLQRIRSSSPDVVHINTALTVRAVCRDALLARCSRFAGRPVVLSIHGGENLREPFKSSYVENLAGLMLRRTGRVLVLSEDERKFLAERWPGIGTDVLPNAVPLSDIETRKEINGPPVVVFLGRMHESKGLGEIIKACRILRDAGSDFIFRAYGEGPMREFFANEMTTILGDSFEYCGVVSSADKWKALAATDIFVLPSAFEGLSMALLEAMAAGCVVVASNISSISAVINDGENGYLVEPKSSEHLAGVLARLLTEPNKWRPVTEKAVSTIRNNFSIDEYIERLENVYIEVVARDKK